MTKFVNRIFKRIRLLFHKGEPYSLYKKILGFYPSDPDLYQLALRHKSASSGNEGKYGINNERLEFLGDSVLQTVISDILYKHFPTKREGVLTALRAQIVKRETVNRIALNIGLDKLIKLSSLGIDPTITSLPGNTLEALVGAIYLDKGYDTCFRFLETNYIGRYIDLDKLAEQENNYKSKLIEWGQRQKLKVYFEITNCDIDSHNIPMFTAQAIIAEKLRGGIGQGQTKKKAHQQAAQQTFALLKHDTAFRNALQTLKHEIRANQQE